jgi:hypothetical protein
MGEIGLHTVTHTTKKETIEKEWENELTYNLNYLKKYSEFDDIKSSRAPFLAFNDNYFTILQ